MMLNSPIGIFDSGMGGLTVLKELRKELPEEDFIYFGDTAHLPYGSKSPEAVRRYSRNIAGFLLEKNIKFLIIACNTASVYALNEIEEAINIPVMGVLKPGASAAARATAGRVGVIGTYGTVRSRAYENEIERLRPGTEILSKPCPLFVPLIEEGWTEHSVTRSIADIYLKELSGAVDSVILACTHYPLIKELIKDSLGPEVSVIDSAVEVAREARKSVEKIGGGLYGSGKMEFYVSDAPEVFRERAPLFLGMPIPEVRQEILE